MIKENLLLFLVSSTMLITGFIVTRTALVIILNLPGSKAATLIIFQFQTSVFMTISKAFAVMSILSFYF